MVPIRFSLPVGLTLTGLLHFSSLFFFNHLPETQTFFSRRTTLGTESPTHTHLRLHVPFIYCCVHLRLEFTVMKQFERSPENKLLLSECYIHLRLMSLLTDQFVCAGQCSSRSNKYQQEGRNKGSVEVSIYIYHLFNFRWLGTVLFDMIKI